MKSTVTLALAVLLIGSGSMVPGPTAAVAVLTMVEGDAVVVMAMTVNVADPPAARSTVVAMFPDPEAGHEEPAVAARAMRQIVIPELQQTLPLVDQASLAYVRDAIDKYWSRGPFELTLHVGVVSGRRKGSR